MEESNFSKTYLCVYGYINICKDVCVYESHIVIFLTVYQEDL